MKKKESIKKISICLLVVLFAFLCTMGGFLIGKSIYKEKNTYENNEIKRNEKKNRTENDEIIENKNSEVNNIQIENEPQIIPETINNEQNETTKTINKVIVIDPGHQIKGNSDQEPIGPGASETKAKVTGGATGVSTGQTEYALNLKVALLLQKKLQDKGYTVIMTRSTNEVDISNRERAEIANNANADVFIRVHANSSDNQSVKGILTLCQTSQNKYNGYLSEQSCKLSELVLDKMVEKTGGINKGVTKTDTMSGINWSKVPTTIIEMGFLSNPEEDKLLSTSEYQEKIVDGIVEGIEEFLKK